MKEIEKLLIKFGEDTVNEIISEIIRKDVIKTGALKNSIDYELIETSDGLEIRFKMLEYGKFVDEGTIYIKPREFFQKVIERESQRMLEDLEDEIEKEFYKSLGIK